MDSTAGKGKMGKLASALIIGVVLLVGLVLINNIFFKSDEAAASGVISGSLDINGVVPEGATVTLMQKQVDSEEGVVEFSSIPNPTDGSDWTFAGADEGKTYVIQGVIKSSNGVELVKSNALTVTSPASNEVLTFNLRQKGLTGVAKISGIVEVNGYYPSGSTISIFGKSENVDDFTAVVEDVPAFTEKAVSYDKAVAGLGYEVIGYLYDADGVKIGESDVLSVVAPASNEVLTINSEASNSEPTNPTSSPSRISGTIDFNGAAPSNSRIVILQRLSGNGNYQVALDNVNPEDGVAWEWTGAKEATWYDMVAVLKQRQDNGTDKDIASSTETTVAAPAINVMFHINSGVAKPTPSGGIAQNCISFDSGSNSWAVSVTFPYVEGAKSYWYQIGTSSGASDIENFTRNSTNQNGEVVEVTLNNAQTYFARYASSEQENLSTGSDQFSSFSPSTQLRCSN